MKLLDLTFDDAPTNIALDEALVEQADSGNQNSELLRLWEPRRPIVVLGRSSSIDKEVQLEFCRQNEIAVVRRASGGATIATGPGCLMYAVLLDYRKRPQLRMLDRAHQFVMAQTQSAIKRLDVDVHLKGISDLTIGDRKVSGNSLRCKRNWMIYHGTLLCGFSIDLIAQCLQQPQRQPEYRRGRAHHDFLTQLPVTTDRLKDSLISQWRCESGMASWPRALTEQLVRDKYARDDWTFRI